MSFSAMIRQHTTRPATCNFFSARGAGDRGIRIAILWGNQLRSFFHSLNILGSWAVPPSFRWRPVGAFGACHPVEAELPVGIGNPSAAKTRYRYFAFQQSCLQSGLRKTSKLLFSGTQKKKVKEKNARFPSSASQ